MPCRICEDPDRRIRARRLCSRCYGLHLKKRAVERWDLSRPETLKYYPNSDYWRTERYFDHLQKSYLSQVEQRIGFIESMANRRKSCPEPLSVENILRRVGYLAGAGDDLHYGYAGYIARKFDIEGRTALFNLLRDIEETTEKFRFSLGKAMDEYDKQRKR